MKQSFGLGTTIIITIIDKKMSSIERIRFFHYEYLDALREFGPKLNTGLQIYSLNEVDIVTNDIMKSEELRKYKLWFQLTSKIQFSQCGKTRS